MSFSSGFNAGYSVFTDFAKLGMQRERMQMEEDVEFGYYSDKDGNRVDKSEVFNEQGDLLEGFTFNPGRSQVRAEQLDDLTYKNSDAYRELSEKMRTAQLNNTNQIAESRRIMNMKNLGEAEATALYGFYEEFNPIFEDPEQFQSFSQQKKDFFYHSIATHAQDIQDRFGFSPLDIFKDQMIPGYQTAAELTNMIQKNPSSIETLDLQSYSEGLNSLFSLQTDKFKGKKFKQGDREGTIESVSLDFSDYEIDPDTNRVILNANYTVNFGEDNVETIPGVLNDTNRSVVDPSLAPDDRVALSLTDLLDHASAGTALIAQMISGDNLAVIESLRESQKLKATLYDRLDVGVANRVDSQVANIYANEISSISSRFKAADLDVSYQELFDLRGGNNQTAIDNKEEQVVSSILNNLSPTERNKLLVRDEQSNSGFRVRRNDKDEIMPYYDFKFLVHRSKDVIREELLSGASPNIVNNPFVNEIDNKAVFSFENLPEFSFNSDLQAIEDAVDPNTFKLLEEFLLESNVDVNTTNILSAMQILEKQTPGGIKARGE